MVFDSTLSHDTWSIRGGLSDASLLSTRQWLQFFEDSLVMSKKRALDSFFTPISQKKNRSQPTTNDRTPLSDQPVTNHPNYPYPIPHFPPHLEEALSEVPASEGKEINDQADLDLLYFQPYIPSSIERELFDFLRSELFFYRVKYKIKRGSIETDINTPR